MRTLEADGFHSTLLSLLLVGILLVVWLAWFFLAQITLYEVSYTARLVRPDRAVADFPLASLGRIQPGQPARLQLDSFPWTQYGTISARVKTVTGRVDESRIQVEVVLDPTSNPAIPLQRNLTGSVEITVDRAAPAILVLRAAGLRQRPFPSETATNNPVNR